MEEKQLELAGNIHINASTVNSTTVNTSTSYDVPLQSAYRPSARPTSKYAAPSPELVVSTSGNSVTVVKGIYLYTYASQIWCFFKRKKLFLKISHYKFHGPNLQPEGSQRKRGEVQEYQLKLA